MREQPTVGARGAIAEVGDGAGGRRPIPQSPYRFSAARSGVLGPAPRQGEHNLEVLCEWLGKSAADVRALTASGVLKTGEEEA